MEEQNFKNIIFRVAESLKGSSLTERDLNNIIENFNKSKASNSYLKAQEAIKKAVKQSDNHYHYRTILEKSGSSSLDNLDDLLRQMKESADKWDQKNE